MARLKKRSGSSDTPKPPDHLVYFIDRCLGRHDFPRALLDAGLAVELHVDHFAPDCRDEEWLAAVGRRGWIVITRDLRIRYRVVEREAVQSSGARVISLTARQLTATDLGKAFAAAVSAVEQFVAITPGPFIATMSRSGELKVVGELN